MTAERPRHDLFIVHGKNWNRHRFSPSKPIELSEASKINALAGARAYEIGLAETILFSTGKTASEHDPSEARAMFTFINDEGYRLPPSAVLFQEKSFDTKTEAEENIKIIAKLRAANVAVMSVTDHLPRVVDIYTSQGIPVDGYASENLASALSLYDAARVAAYERSWQRKLIVAQEWVLRTEHKVDQNGTVSNWLARKLRT